MIIDRSLTINQYHSISIIKVIILLVINLSIKFPIEGNKSGVLSLSFHVCAIDFSTCKVENKIVTGRDRGR